MTIDGEAVRPVEPHQGNSAMEEHLADVAFFACRVEVSTAKALSSTDSCARASHIGMAKAYSDKLAVLTGSTLPTCDQAPAARGRPSSTETASDTSSRRRPDFSTQALSRWDNEGGAVARRADIARRR